MAGVPAAAGCRVGRRSSWSVRRAPIMATPDRKIPTAPAKNAAVPIDRSALSSTDSTADPAIAPIGPMMWAVFGPMPRTLAGYDSPM